MQKKDTENARIRRISIDERLDEELVKIGITDLLPGHTDLIKDALDSWSEEKVRLIRPSTFLRTFGLSKSDPQLEILTGELTLGPKETDLKGALWRSLEEGQVYLSGEIEVMGLDRSNIDSIVASPGSHSVARIDRIPTIKERHKDLYSAALKKGS